MEFVADAIRNELNADNVFDAVIRVQSHLVSYFSACKALFDAGSITLNMVYDLDLTPRQQDFGQKIFWKQLAARRHRLTRGTSRIGRRSTASRNGGIQRSIGCQQWQFRPGMAHQIKSKETK
ncbi:MAG: hypothetical protein IH942_02205 [Acidobacteria bacterium]|nr:hypothetical protein [Acidobacteriota bacterium]